MTITIEDFIEYCEANIKEADTIFEIGAREANDSLLLKEAYPDATIHAFEACDSEYNKHKDDHALSSINYHNIAIWSENTTLLFHEKGIGMGISSFRDRGQQYGQAAYEKSAISIESFCKDNDIASIDIVKIDVEGCAYEVLQGFGDVLDTVKVLHIETEQTELFSGQHLEEEVFEFLRQKGFTLQKHSFCCITQYDSIWTKL